MGEAMGSAIRRQTAPSIANSISAPPVATSASCPTRIACRLVSSSIRLATNALTSPMRNGVPRKMLAPYVFTVITPAPTATRPATTPANIPTVPPRPIPCPGSRSGSGGSSTRGW